jgi:hypothetical protein
MINNMGAGGDAGVSFFSNATSMNDDSSIMDTTTVGLSGKIGNSIPNPPSDKMIHVS